MDELLKLKVEVERIKNEELSKSPRCRRNGLQKIMARVGVCNKIISYIDSIVKESGDCIYGRSLEERKRVCKFCSAACLARLNEPFEILSEKVVMDETPAPEDFEPIDTGDLIFYDETKMTASRYAEKEREPDEVSDLAVKDNRKDFIAGANWKEEQLLSTAVDGVIVGNWRNQEDAPYELYAESYGLDLTKFKAGERVKIIIIKDDGTGKL